MREPISYWSGQGGTAEAKEAINASPTRKRVALVIYMIIIKNIVNKLKLRKFFSVGK